VAGCRTLLAPLAEQASLCPSLTTSLREERMRGAAWGVAGGRSARWPPAPLSDLGCRWLRVAHHQRVGFSEHSSGDDDNSRPFPWVPLQPATRTDPSSAVAEGGEGPRWAGYDARSVAQAAGSPRKIAAGRALKTLIWSALTTTESTRVVSPYHPVRTSLTAPERSAETAPYRHLCHGRRADLRSRESLSDLYPERVDDPSRAVPDATSTLVGRSLLLMIGILTVAVVGAS
jgi:hypothetical protein